MEAPPLFCAAPLEPLGSTWSGLQVSAAGRQNPEAFTWGRPYSQWGSPGARRRALARGGGGSRRPYPSVVCVYEGWSSVPLPKYWPT